MESTSLALRLDISSLSTAIAKVFLRRTSTSFKLLQSNPIQYLPAGLLFLVFCFCLSRARCNYKGHAQETRRGLQALLTVVTPTSAWATDCSALVVHASSARSKTIKLPLSNLTHAICSGTMELRDSNDLPDLFRKRLRVYGWLVCLDVEMSWWLTVPGWVLSCQFWSFQSITMNSEQLSPFAFRKFDPPKTSRPTVKSVTFLAPEEINKPTSYSLTPPLLSRNTPSTLYLDFIPHPQLEASIRNLQSVLRKGVPATLEFTTIAPHIPFLSTSFILCALPFLPRKHLATDQTQKTALRTSTPLLTSLHRVVELLTSTPSKLSIESILNVSASCVTGLNALEWELQDDRGIRTAFIDKWGVEGWREHRLMMAWEAGLLSAGYLTRWIVVVRK